MKHALPHLVTILLLCSTVTFAQAKIWRVNSNERVNADFSNIQDAVDAADSGDTLYIEYGYYLNGVTIDKRLVLIGPGFFLEENYPGLIYYSVNNSGINNYIQLTEGADGTVLTALKIGTLLIDNASNIIVQKCYLTNPLNIRPHSNYEPKNIIIRNSYIGPGYDQSQASILIHGNASKIRINNNFLERGVGVSRSNFGGDRAYLVDALFIENNIIKAQGTHLVTGAIDVDNATIANNIILSGPIIGNNNHTINNLSADNIGEDKGNLSNVDMNVVFVELPTATDNNISPDGRWQLSENSPAKGAGTAGTDAGIYGGTSSYSLSGLPSIPLIYDINSIPNTTREAGLPIMLKIRVNN